MDTITKKQIAISAVRNCLGNAQDNLYRAKSAFAKTTGDFMNKPYGASGQTPNQIIANYEARVKECESTLRWLESL